MKQFNFLAHILYHNIHGWISEKGFYRSCSIIFMPSIDAFLLYRPPGHHAMKVEYCGYCFFNNVALAAQEALDRGLERILIVDWDIHHGQASQQMFYEDPR